MNKILVVDDDQENLQLVKYILTSRGFDVQTHSSGLDVPEIVRSYDPNLILLDVRLPGASGIEISKSLKQQIHPVPIILFSAFSEHQNEFIESKADDFVRKPFDIGQLVDKINLCVSHSAQ